MFKGRAFTLILLGVIALAACQPQAQASNITAALSELQGKVDLKAAGAPDFSPATATSILDINGQIQTGSDGRVRLDLSSGTIIRVAPSSLFTLTANAPAGSGGLATKISLIAGKIFIILNGGSTNVETPSGVASVQGSYLSVEVDPVTHDVYVMCAEGNCSVSNGAGSVDLTGGHKTKLFHQNADGTWTLAAVENMSPDDFQKWLDDNPEAKTIFENAMATLTAMAPVPTEAPVVQPVNPPGPASSTCFKLLQPDSGALLPFQGQVDFKWEAQPGATKYVITFIEPDGTVLSFDTTSTDFKKYIEIMPAAGQFTWQVEAFNGDQSICKAAASTFTKPNSKYIGPDHSGSAPACDPCDPMGSCYDMYAVCGGG